MLVIEVELLGGRYAATAHNDRSRSEWPPHPARFYSALVAALHDHDPCDLGERAALEWLESQPPPALDVDLSVTEQVGRREVRSVFVPVNDVTLVGDPEEALREASSTLSEIAARPEGEPRNSDIRKAQREVAKREADLARFLRQQQEIEEDPGASAIKNAAALLPERRTRQERSFPVIVPERPTFAFLWPDADAGPHRRPLERLCERVTRLGHSSSLVRCFVSDVAVQPSLVPDGVGDFVLRIVGPKQLERLEAAHARHQAVEGRVLPARPQRYGRPEPSIPGIPESVLSDEWIIFERISGPRLLASRGIELADVLRSAVLERRPPGALPASLSGKDLTGAPASEPHLAFIACPFVGHPNADGSIQGLAIVLPRRLCDADRMMLHKLLGELENAAGEAADGYAIALEVPGAPGNGLQRVVVRRAEVSTKDSLRTSRWCRPSQRFVTATPIALDRNPGNLRSNVDRAAHKAAAEAERSVADACERIGLPRPQDVSVSLAPLLSGGQHVRQFAPWPSRPGRSPRVRVHAEICFSEPVRGPVLLGAGRYLGLGLCLPVEAARQRRT